MAFNDYEAVIGLEIHVQLQTKSKLFCSSSAHFGSGDNENICPNCTGQPGALPVVNEQAVEFGIKTGLALNCSIRKDSVFARKQYFYPDSPRGYQISQFDKPLCEGGYLEITLDGRLKRITIERAHMEEDAGKSTHHGEYSLINLNRAGVPLMEIVSAPVMSTPQEAAEYARTMRKVVRYIGVCDGNLEEGSLRCDCNVSVRRKGESKLGTKVEIKNINSFRFIEKAIEFEIQRQIDCKETGEPIVQETRLYDPDKNRTFSMRSKEEAHDYRYFPDPDQLTLQIEQAQIDRIAREMPELPTARAKRFVELGLSDFDAQTLTQEIEIADYFEKAAGKNPKAAANWIISDLMRELNEGERSVADSPIRAEQLAQLVSLIDAGTISGKIAKTVFAEMWTSGLNPDVIVKEKGLTQITDTKAIEKIVDDVIAANPAQLAEYRSGKEKIFGFFVGQAMKASKGQASPDLMNEMLRQKLKG
jgi:aspartyl-tRNA(Asn)/glutamyl-tRNA(Gln) amidotransferase subunit B